MRHRFGLDILAAATLTTMIATTAQAQIGIKTIYDYPVAQNPERVLTRDKSNAVVVDATTKQIVVNTRMLMPAERDKIKELEQCVTASGDILTLNRWRPTGNDPTKAECLWFQSGPELLKNTEFFASNGAVTATTEILADVFYGLRVSFATAVTAPAGDDDQANETPATAAEENAATRNLNLLAANGGNISLGAAYPLYLRSYVHPNDKKRRTGYMLSNVIGRLGGTVGVFEPAGGSTAATTYKWGDVNGSAEVGLESRATFNTEGNVFSFIGYLRTSVIGGTEKFSDAIGNKNHNAFGSVRAAVGARFGGAFTLGLGWNYFTDGEIPGDGLSLTLGFAR